MINVHLVRCPDTVGSLRRTVGARHAVSLQIIACTLPPAIFEQSLKRTFLTATRNIFTKDVICLVISKKQRCRAIYLHTQNGRISAPVEMTDT